MGDFEKIVLFVMVGAIVVLLVTKANFLFGALGSAGGGVDAWLNSMAGNRPTAQAPTLQSKYFPPAQKRAA